MAFAKKSLGQHWLADQATLDYIVNAADLKPNETVLEIGPGTGNLTSKLLASGAEVLVVEKDEALAAKLPPAPKLKIIAADILQFNLNALSAGYKVVANLPYYLTSQVLRILCEAENPPSKLVLLVQKEVAERICAEPGQMSLLAVSIQLYYRCQLGRVVPAQLFQPAPKVDSQVVILERQPEPLFPDLDSRQFFRIVKAGFSAKRKKLRSSLAGGLKLSKERVERLLDSAGVRPDARAQELSLDDWHKIYTASLSDT